MTCLNLGSAFRQASNCLESFKVKLFKRRTYRCWRFRIERYDSAPQGKRDTSHRLVLACIILTNPAVKLCSSELSELAFATGLTTLRKQPRVWRVHAPQIHWPKSTWRWWAQFGSKFGLSLKSDSDSVDSNRLICKLSDPLPYHGPLFGSVCWQFTQVGSGSTFFVWSDRERFTLNLSAAFRSRLIFDNLV